MYIICIPTICYFQIFTTIPLHSIYISEINAMQSKKQVTFRLSRLDPISSLARAVPSVGISHPDGATCFYQRILKQLPTQFPESQLLESLLKQ